MPRPKKDPAAQAAATPKVVTPSKPSKPALSGSIGAVKAAITAATAPSAIVPLALVSMAALLAMPEIELVESMKSQTQTAASQHIGMGKMLFALGQKRGDMTLSKFVKKHGLGEIDSSAYKTANAYRMVGEGHGSIEEKHFDASRLRHLITTSQIINLLDKFDDGPEKQEIRECVAVALRTPNETTADVLKGIYAQLKPEPVTPEGPEQEQDETVAEKTDRVRLTALDLAGLLLEEIKASGTRAMTCTDPAMLANEATDIPKLKEAIAKALASLPKLTEEINRAAAAVGMLEAVVSGRAEHLAPVEFAAAA